MDLEMKKETPETLKPYEFHSLEFSINGTEAKSDCPSCGAVKNCSLVRKQGSTIASCVETLETNTLS
jgi:predicted RNA-binding Zn-ribbon protein involved in translation (DUF1610 family)